METILTVTCVLKTRLRTLAVGIAVVICVSATADSAWAKQCQWTGGGAPDNKWGNPLNWTACDGAPGTPGIPLAGDDLLFRDGAAQTTNVNDIDGLSVHGVLIVGRGAGPAFEHWNITGDPLHPLTVTGSITAESPADPAGNGRPETVATAGNAEVRVRRQLR